MKWLFEDPTLLLVLLVVGEGLFAVALVKSGRMIVLAWMALLLVVVLAGLLVERLVVTQAEEVETTLDEICGALEANDLAGVLAMVSPQSHQIRGQLQTLLPRLDISEAHVGGDLAIRVNRLTSPPSATADFTGRVKAAMPSEGLSPGNYIRRFTVHFQREGDAWLITDYTQSDPRGAQDDRERDR